MESSSGKKQAATVVVGALAVAWLALEIVFKPLFKKLHSDKDKPDSDEAAAPPAAADETAAPPAAAEGAAAPPPAEEDASAPAAADA